MRSLLVLGILLAALLAGCSESPAPAKPTDGLLDVSTTTGGIRGLVVDQSVAPVAGATITLSGGQTTQSDEAGLFNFTGLAPGDYFLQVTKPGFAGTQSSTTVVAGVADPPIVKLLLQRLSTAQPYLDFFKLDGFYECGYGIPFQTDACDWAYRTAWDEYNHSAPGPLPKPLPAPRTVQGFANTQYIDVPADTWSVVQEAFWGDESVPQMMISLDETPIDNACDCSPSYLNVVMASPTYARMDTFGDDGSTSAPAGVTAAARGFLPFTDVDPGNPTGVATTAVNFSFVVITSLFHNYPAPEGWTFETKDQFPIG